MTNIILSMDLSLSGSAFSILELNNNYIIIKELMFVNNKVSKMINKFHGEKLANIHDNLDDLLNRYNPTDIVREKGFSKFSLSTQAIFKAVGIVDFTLHQHGIKQKIDEIAPTSVKKLVTGSGKSDKSQVEEYVRKYLFPTQKDIKFETDDLSDAVAVAIAYCIENKLLKQLT